MYDNFNQIISDPYDDEYDDDNIPDIDAPLEIIPDEVPRRDGPGGESC